MSKYSLRNYIHTAHCIGEAMRKADLHKVPSTRVVELRGIALVIQEFCVSFAEDNSRFVEGTFLAAIEGRRNQRD